jgi:hypothetical protein
VSICPHCGGEVEPVVVHDHGVPTIELVATGAVADGRAAWDHAQQVALLHEAERGESDP